MVIVEVPVAPGLAIVTGVPAIVSPGMIGALTVTDTVVVAVIVPVAASTPLTVSVTAPSGVADVLWMVRLVVPLDAPTVAVAGAQLRPATTEEQVKFTTPVKPFAGVTVTVDVVLEPGPAITAAVELSAKPGAGAAVTVTGITVEAVILPVATSVPVSNIEYVSGVVAEVESTFTVAVAAEVPVIFTFSVLHVGVETAFAGPVIMQVRLTAPVKPPKGVTTMLAGEDAPGSERTRVAGPPTPKRGTGTPVTSMRTSFDVDEA
jgi:hypothetical protein